MAARAAWAGVLATALLASAVTAGAAAPAPLKASPQRRRGDPRMPRI